MSYFLLAVTAIIAILYASRYYRQKRAIRLLSESLATRTSILTHSTEFRGTSRNWMELVGELNQLIAEIDRLDKQSSDRLRQIETTLGNLQEGVLIVDRDNYILLVNNALQKVFPALGESVGKRVESGLHSSEFLEFIREVKRVGGGIGKEIVFSEAQGEIWMEVSAARLEAAEEANTPWYLFVLHNTTKLKVLESMRKQFVANASHELKTPVSVIKGYAETLVADHAGMKVEDRHRFLNVIQRHSERLALLINDLLSLSRLENESPKLELAEINVTGWLKELSFEYRQSLGSEGRELVLNLPEERSVMLRIDVLKIRQVLDNLVENAKKYTPAEGKIGIGCSIEENSIEIWVEDEGPGVPETDLSRIFERFYRVDKGRSRDTGGTGLGLSIVKHIIDWHNGRVWAENVEDQGLRVSFRLPVAESPVVAEAI
jgi:two-component system phosphate regulon sensor histidine kinase PhoR